MAANDSNRVAALRHILDCLDNYPLDEESTDSEEGEPQLERIGLDHPVHLAVVAAQNLYPVLESGIHRLPQPGRRLSLRLQRISRGRLSGGVLAARDDFAEWVESEIAREEGLVPDGRGQPPRAKRSTRKGEAAEKLLAMLTAYHDKNGLKTPVGNNELATMADVSHDSASQFFKKHWGGHEPYKIECRRYPGKVRDKLSEMNGENIPSELWRPLPDNL